jgi:hypothetical protein
LAGSAIDKVITGYGGNDGMFKVQFVDSFGDFLGFFRVRQSWMSAANVAKLAVAATNRAQDHESCCPLTPAFALVWACCTATNGVQPVETMIAVDSGIVLPGREFNFKPIRLTNMAFFHPDLTLFII